MLFQGASSGELAGVCWVWVWVKTTFRTVDATQHHNVSVNRKGKSHIQHRLWTQHLLNSTKTHKVPELQTRTVNGCSRIQLVRLPVKSIHYAAESPQLASVSVRLLATCAHTRSRS